MLVDKNHFKTMPDYGLDPDRPSIPCISRNAQAVYLRF